MKFRPILLAVLGAVALDTAGALAQGTGVKASNTTACCAITAIDAATGVVTARDPAGKTFQFKVADGALLKSLKIGQSVASADFVKARVSIKYGEPCCNIVTTPAAVPDPKPIEPCCGITAIDAGTGIVTAKEVATGRLFRFEVKDRTLLASLKVGQKVFADFGSSKVRIHGAEPCCAIIGHGGN